MSTNANRSQEGSGPPSDARKVSVRRSHQTAGRAVGENPTHSRRGEALLLNALSAGSPIEEAAAAAGVSTRTAYRRLTDPGFQTRLRTARDELISGALGELATVAAEAVGTLQRLLCSNDERVQLGAARALLDQLLRLREAVLLEQRLATIERRQLQRGSRR